MTGRSKRTIKQSLPLATALALGLAALPPTTVSAQSQSAPLAAALTGLSPAQRAFIADPENLKRFGLTAEKLHALLQGRSAEEASQLVASMMETIAAAEYQPAPGPQPEGQSLLDPVGDMAEIPLNPLAGDFNASNVLKPAILDEFKRDPGTFSLKRYMYERDGIPTFAGAPVALRQEDLVAGKVEVAFVGVPIDLSSGWRDASNAPGIMRAMYGIGGYDIYAGVDPTLELAIADFGNIGVNRMHVEPSMKHVRAMLGQIIDAGAVPFVVGGDNSVMIPTASALADEHGSGNVAILHLGAHYGGARDLAHYYSDEQPVSRLISEGQFTGRNFVQVGIRGADMTPQDAEWMTGHGVRNFTMADIEKQGWDQTVDAALGEIKARGAKTLISFDVSVLDPAFVSGSDRPYPGGLTMREAVPLVRRACAETDVAGFEMIGVTPMLDLSYATALNANYIMHACLTGIAMRKKGLVQP